MKSFTSDSTRIKDASLAVPKKASRFTTPIPSRTLLREVPFLYSLIDPFI
jgi:hypothetical protein